MEKEIIYSPRQLIVGGQNHKMPDDERKLIPAFAKILWNLNFISFTIE
jgi:hypothetical protein